MQKKQKTLALAGAGLAAAAALGVTGATMAGASQADSATVMAGSGSGSSESDTGSTDSNRPVGPEQGMRDAGGKLTADAASKAIAAAADEVDGGTVSGVRALSDGTYVVGVTKSDETHVHVLVNASFAVTSVEERGMGRGPGAPDREDDDSTGSTDSTDANTGTTTSPPAT